MTWTVYKHTNKINGKVYIGITCQPVERRWRTDGSGYKKCVLFYRAIQKYGWDAFTHEILCMGLSKEQAEETEKNLIAEYKANEQEYGYNIANGGSVKSVSEQTKRKISESVKRSYVKERHHNYGKHYSDEFKKKLSDAHKGKMCGEDHPNFGKPMPQPQKDKISSTMKERKIQPSAEARAKGAQARIGAKNSEEWLIKIKQVRSVPVVQVSKDGMEIKIYTSITAAAADMNISGSNITSVCKGKRKYAGGYSWKYVGGDTA